MEDKEKERDWLEAIIQTNRSDFDFGSPPEATWKAIEAGLDNKKKRSGMILLSLRTLAAIFFGLMVSGFLIGKVYYSKSTQGIDPAFATQLKLVEDHFNKEVKLKINEAKTNTIYSTDVANDIDQLDRVYLELREEMLRKKDINNEELLSQMIKNYQLRISLLETLIEKHAQIKTRSNHQNLPIKIEENLKI